LNPNTRTREVERAIIERIQLFHEPLRIGTFEPQDPPEPDFHITSHKAPIGLELTRFFPLGENRKRQESEQDHIVALAREIYAGRGLPVLNVRVNWDYSYLPTKRDRGSIPESLAAIVSDNAPSIGGQIKIDLCDEPMPVLPPGVNSVDIDRMFDYEFHLWQSPRYEFVPDIHSDEIQSVIDLKSKKFSKYNGPCDEIWLLIVAEGFAPSSFGRPTDELKAHKYQGRFQRAFFATLLPPQVIDLNVKVPTNQASSRDVGA